MLERDGRAHGHDRERARGDWTRARKPFDAAGEDAEALEGLGLAAWWLDDEDALDARERAYRLYRERGDDRAGSRSMACPAATATRTRVYVVAGG
jgi:hypothetical protein